MSAYADNRTVSAFVDKVVVSYADDPDISLRCRRSGAKRQAHQDGLADRTGSPVS